MMEAVGRLIIGIANSTPHLCTSKIVAQCANISEEEVFDVIAHFNQEEVVTVFNVTVDRHCGRRISLQNDAETRKACSSIPWEACLEIDKIHDLMLTRRLSANFPLALYWILHRWLQRRASLELGEVMQKLRQIGLLRHDVDHPISKIYFRSAVLGFPDMILKKSPPCSPPRAAH